MSSANSPTGGSPDAPVTISDPRTLRALAHPARIAIMEHLALDGPATATECAQVAGLSPSACSYHLRALARHGFIAEDRAAAADGRQRPWRARGTAINIEDRAGAPAAQRIAGRMLSDTVSTRFGERKAEYADRMDECGPEWQAAAGSRYDYLHLTAAELAEAGRRIADVLADYRRLDPAARPAGARRVGVLIDLVPWLDPPAGAGSQA